MNHPIVTALAVWMSVGMTITFLIRFPIRQQSAPPSNRLEWIVFVAVFLRYSLLWPLTLLEFIRSPD